MKKLTIALLILAGLGVATDAFARYGRHGHYRATECGSCFRGCGECAEECPPPPCCEREQVITVREAPHKVCGWVCPDGTREIPAAEARHGDY